jgi:methionyl-tRNA formyltransferase
MLALWQSMVQQHGTLGAAGQIPAQIQRLAERRRILRAREERQRNVEREIFGAEVERLRASSHLQPIDVPDPNANSFVETVRGHSPWLLLTLGGPLYRRPLLQAARGGTINQHAGWSPEYRGTNTTDWALYHRRLDRVGSTVHISATGADSGGILRRSHPCLCADDTAESIFARVVALGTELVIETVEELLQDGRTRVAEQPTDRGRTYLSRELDTSVLIRSAHDFESGWLAEALTRETRW